MEIEMLDEIRSFFGELWEQPAPPWPEGVPAINPATGEDLRALSEKYWRLRAECIEGMEAKIVDLYDCGADIPAMIDLIDDVVAIIRRKGQPADARLDEIGQLMRSRGATIARS
jgi:hypothetical protein